MFIKGMITSIALISSAVFAQEVAVQMASNPQEEIQKALDEFAAMWNDTHDAKKNV
jgi:hypothetical protein